MKWSVFDIEADSLTPTKIHCFCYHDSDGNKGSLTNYKEIAEYVTTYDGSLVGHNIQLYDVPAIEKLLGVKVECRLVDTLALSWVLEPSRVRHGLEQWGEELGVQKPKVDDWENEDIYVYVHRCESDVEINYRLWERFRKHLNLLYEGDWSAAMRFIRYLEFKLDCAREQQEVKWRLDVNLAKDSIEKMEVEKEAKVAALTAIMPKPPIYKTVKRPKDMYKQNGELSVRGRKWKELVEELKVHPDSPEVTYVSGYKEPNPGSTDQIKDWLFSLGWKPETYKFVRDKKTGDTRKIEQINLPRNGGLCPSIKRLFKKHPELELLDGIGVLSHRIALLNGFLNNVDEDGYVYAGIQGLTNTLRFKHSICVNLPGVDKPWGKEVRGCLIAPEGYELCGSDMSALEDRTKQHYMWDYDPEFVKQQMSPDFDAHTDFAVFAGAMTKEQEQEFKEHKTPELGAIRKVYKAVNYTCTYGAGAATTARAAGVSIEKGAALVEAYWKRNWAIKAIADDCIVKEVRGQKWLFNPVSKFWYSLRADKDRFSTLNQGTGVYCFDTWVRNVRRQKRIIIGQFHDEIITPSKLGERAETTRVLRLAIDMTNKQLKLNRELDVGIEFGDTYADIH